MPHKPNHNLLQNLKFSGSPSDATRTNVDPTSYMPKMKSTMRQSTLMDDPDAIKQLSQDLAEGMVTPFAGTVKNIARGIQAGRRLANQPPPTVNRSTSGDFTIYTSDKKIGSPSITQQLPGIKFREKTRRVFKDPQYQLVESVTPARSSGIAYDMHKYQLRPQGKFSPRDNLVDMTFTLRKENGINYMNNFNFYIRGRGTSAHSGRILANLFDRMGNQKWAIGEDSLTEDSFYVLTRGVLRKAAEISFETKPATRLHSERSMISLGRGQFSPFAKAVKKMEAQGMSREQALNSFMLKHMKDIQRTGKVAGTPRTGVQRGRATVTPFYIKSYKDKLAVMLGIPSAKLPQYLADLDNEDAR